MTCLIFALGEDHALWIIADGIERRLQPAGHRIEPALEPRDIGLQSTIGLRATPESIAALATAAGTCVISADRTAPE
jgi:hypothetical protein